MDDVVVGAGPMQAATRAALTTSGRASPSWSVGSSSHVRMKRGPGAVLAGAEQGDVVAAVDEPVDEPGDDALDAAVALRRDGEVGRRDHRDAQRTRDRLSAAP